MNIQKIGVRKRENRGRGHCRRLRKSGRIPVVFYGKSRNESYSLSELDFRVMGASGGASLVELESDDGDASLALIKDIQRDPCTDAVLHVDFIEVTRGEELQTRVPLVIIGEAHGVKMEGGIIDAMARDIEIRCRPSLLPSSIEIDVTELSLGESLHVSSLPQLEGVIYLGDSDLTLVSCVGTASGRAEAEDEVGEEGEEGEESEGDESDDSAEDAPSESTDKR